MSGGGHGKDDPDLAGHVAQLLRELADAVDPRLNESQTELMQALMLMDDAIIKLHSSFAAIVTQFDALCGVAGDVISGSCPPDEAMERARLLRERVSNDFNAAMTTMQYHDMTSQLIHRVADSLALVNGMMAALPPPSAASGGSPAALAAHLEGALAAVRGCAASGSRGKPVSQADLGSGEVDLF